MKIVSTLEDQQVQEVRRFAWACVMPETKNGKTRVWSHCALRAGWAPPMSRVGLVMMEDNMLEMCRALDERAAGS